VLCKHWQPLMMKDSDRPQPHLVQQLVECSSQLSTLHTGVCGGQLPYSCHQLHRHVSMASSSAGLHGHCQQALHLTLT